MLESLQILFSHTVYVRVRADSFHIRHIEGKKERVTVPKQPFSHECLLVGDFTIAGKAQGRVQKII